MLVSVSSGQALAQQLQVLTLAPALLLHCTWLQTDDAINILAECTGAVKSDVRVILDIPAEHGAM